MGHQPDKTRGGEPGTLGRLGGLSAAEADRGQRALWLSGDGYRAALFHLGALTRLNELGLLAQLATVGAVSGGSIVAALLATRVPWPLHGAYRDWPERVAEPLRAITRRNVRARAILRRRFPGGGAEAALEERYARELIEELGGESRRGPRIVFGASGLTLSGLAAGWEECLEWEIGGSSRRGGYEARLVEDAIAAVRTDLDSFGEAEQAVLENHGYLLADAALREMGLADVGGIETLPPDPPHPDWMSEERVREALAASGRRTRVGRLRPRSPRAPGQAAQPSSPRLAELLERHRPVLQYDSLECYRADPVEAIRGAVRRGRCNTLHRADGTLIAAADPSGAEARLELGFLGAAYANGVPAQAGDYLEESGSSHAADAAELRRREGWTDRVYGHARHDEAGRLWLQYWLFFYYDDKGLLGLERREGDWEMVQIRLDAEERPEAVTFARHAGAEALPWEQVDKEASGDGEVAVLYLARGSHAPLPRPGTFAAPVLPDHNDGLGGRVRPELVALGDEGPGWLLWPGRWGSTRRREFYEADSPRGPRQQAHWWDPAGLHAEARPWAAPVAGLGGAAPSPRIEARREGGLAVVSYRFPEPAPGEHQPARIVAAPVGGGDERTGTARGYAVEGREGSFALQLPEGEWSAVRSCVTSERGVPGETVTSRFGEEGERAG